MAYSVTVPVSIHPVTNAKQHNKKKKQHRGNFSLQRRFCFFCTVFKRARTCPPSFPGEGEQKREGGGEDEERKEEKEGRHAVKTKAKPVTPAFQSPFQRMEEEEGGGFAGRFQCVSLL